VAHAQERERPEGPGALKVILAGRLLGNELTLADARTPTDALVTMHLVVAPPRVRHAVAWHAPLCTDALTALACQVGKKAPKPPAPEGVAHPASSGCCVVS
jgi:hypothetical protein